MILDVLCQSLYPFDVELETSLFAQNNLSGSKRPLAERLRPASLENFFGQGKLLGKGGPLLQLVERDLLPSLIIWGPPGCGKTSFAHIISLRTSAIFLKRSAIDLGSKEIREIGAQSKSSKLIEGRSTIVFVDEIHRLNKSQQDSFLPFVEAGDFTLIGATTENPSFEINSALMSRARLIVFERLSTLDLENLLKKAYVELKATEFLQEDSKAYLFALSEGDGRKMLNLVEYIFEVTSGEYALDLSQFKSVLQKQASGHNSTGDSHYDLISALIKSIRGSDPDAALYYLARMLEVHEIPEFIMRRLLILASEDIGNADPRALILASSASHAIERIGLPEGRIVLGQLVTYLASAPKSNSSYTGIEKALEEVSRTGALPVPPQVRNAPTQMMKDMGYGAGYRYAHDCEKGWAKMKFLPEGLKENCFYEPTGRGFEKNIQAYLEWLKSEKK